MATVNVLPTLLAYMREHSGRCQIVFEGPDLASCRAAATAARSAVQTVPHPDEPRDPLPSFVSDLIDISGGATFWFDAADAEAVDGLLEGVLAAMVMAVRQSASGIVTIAPPGPDSAYVEPEPEYGRALTEQEVIAAWPQDVPMPRGGRPWYPSGVAAWQQVGFLFDEIDPGLVGEYREALVEAGFVITSESHRRLDGDDVTLFFHRADCRGHLVADWGPWLRAAPMTMDVKLERLDHPFWATTPPIAPEDWGR